MTNGWDSSAEAWIRDMGDDGDFGRRYVLDQPMLARALAQPVALAIDIGCGEGRFGRMLGQRGVRTLGVDPTRRLIQQAAVRDRRGMYLRAEAEHLPVASASFDLAIAYLSLIDIGDVASAIAEMARVTKPGGRLLIANLNGFNTAGMEFGWITSSLGQRVYFAMDRYMQERAAWCEWRGIRIVNHHRPLSRYMKLFLAQGLELLHFDEPMPSTDAPVDRRASYVRAPWFCVMEWRKPVRGA